jgi:deoxycytidylate deaminase
VAPCRNCAKVLLNTGCKRIVYGDEHSGTEDAKELWVSSGKLWEKAGDQP